MAKDTDEIFNKLGLKSWHVIIIKKLAIPVLERVVESLSEYAAKTDNDFDDIGVELLNSAVNFLKEDILNIE